MNEDQLLRIVIGGAFFASVPYIVQMVRDRGGLGFLLGRLVRRIKQAVSSRN